MEYEEDVETDEVEGNGPNEAELLVDVAQSVQDGAGIDLDIDIEHSQYMDGQGPGQQQQLHHNYQQHQDHGLVHSFDSGGVERPNSGHAMRPENGLGGAETEVEGEGGFFRIRATRHGAAFSSRGGAGGSGAASPLADFMDDAEDAMLVDAPPHARHVLAAAEVGLVDGDGVESNAIDVDATVGGKRKR